MGKTEACCDCAAIHDDVLAHVQEHIVPEDQRQSMAKLFKIFGDNTRCSIMEALNCHEMCVCDLAVLLDMTKSAISHQLKILRDSGIILTKTQSRNRKLWHALAGAAYLRDALGVSDEEIVSAVACHTSGKGDMSLLEKTLFVADYISADRDYPGVEEMRRAADRSLEEAMVEGILFTVNELMEQRLPVAAESIQAYNDAIFTLEQKKEQSL